MAEVKKSKKIVKTEKKTEIKAVKREYKVTVKNVAQSPLKLRLVANMVRTKTVEWALKELSFLNKKGALFISKAIKSGVANAKSLNDISADKLQIKHISVNEAINLKRGRIASRSRVAPIVKRRSHINLVLVEK